MNRHTWKPKSRRRLPAGVILTIMLSAPSHPAAARRYFRLGHAIEAFLARKGLRRGWTQLDVHAFVRKKARNPPQAIQICCDISAMLPGLLWTGELSELAARRIWADLAELCADDPEALDYILLGVREFTGHQSPTGTDPAAA